jgi:2-polyprenyl-3-methyl-5-hydroxy-6-metoxy-1,4-benzoquinol methylase
LINCPICDGSIFQNFIKVKDRFNTSNIKKFQLVKCNCGFIFLNPRPNTDEISNFYNHTDYDPHKNRNFNAYDIIYKIVQKLALKIKYNKIKRLKNKGKLLDIGGGKGEFALFMHKKGFSSSIQDNFSYYNGILDFYTNINKINKKYFDVISMWHVLEHVHNLENLFNSINTILNKNGILVIAVPNHDAIERKYFNDKWAPYDAPRHLYHFNLSSLEKILNKNGFKILKKYSMIQDTFYNILLSINKRSFFSLFKFIFISIISAINIIIRGNNISSTIMVICKKA